MPELPDLEVICEFLSPRLAGVNITSVDARRPLVVRNFSRRRVGRSLDRSPLGVGRSAWQVSAAGA